ncbi:unnamed protein product [Danaus chrysippus]|uniref:(African queen) hypothetical protein n=1 Tax=Danaus chrysippus TaxID=151541 RepID=A0A8J2R9W9_9NEOP|nr:unnamed protein product [Danaus chrysippus]
MSLQSKLRAKLSLSIGGWFSVVHVVAGPRGPWSVVRVAGARWPVVSGQSSGVRGAGRPCVMLSLALLLCAHASGREPAGRRPRTQDKRSHIK